MKRLLITLLCFVAIVAQAQIHWVNPLAEGAMVHGQGWSELNNTYVRLPEHAKDKVRNDVWGLSRNAAGLSLVFRSNAPDIHVRYQVEDGYNYFHMSSTGKSGVDMYATDPNGMHRWCAPQFAPSFGDTIHYNYNALTYSSGKEWGYEFHLYLPLYNTVKWLEIGVADGAMLKFVPVTQEKPIVFYGTSIAQGACASRSGLAWSNIIEREMEHPVVNLGFSGNGRMESALFDLLAEIDARAYVIDCLPNLGADEEETIYHRTLKGVYRLRQKDNTPILLVEHSGYVNEVSSESRSVYRAANALMRKAYHQLLQENVPEIYYLTHDEIGLQQDEMVEGIHPNDLGMRRYADAYERKLREILHEQTATVKPCKQQRDSYCWAERHEQVLALCREKAPDMVLIGNSITHFFGGEPVAAIRRNVQEFDKLWPGHTVHNLGFGWDRIENALWRVYHGELDGYQAQKVVLLIGSNNLSVNDNRYIIDGVMELAAAVAVRQPQAKIYICGILPRTDMPKRVPEVNAQLRERVEMSPYTYIDMTPGMVDANGKIISSLYSDGLHPTHDGYIPFAQMLREGLKK